MGWCHEFGPQITAGCGHPMVAGADACSCPECGVVCKGRFPGCSAVWARGPRAVEARREQVADPTAKDRAGPAARPTADLAATPLPSPPSRQVEPGRGDQEVSLLSALSPLAEAEYRAPAPRVELVALHPALEQLKSQLRALTDAVERQESVLSELVSSGPRSSSLPERLLDKVTNGVRRGTEGEPRPALDPQLKALMEDLVDHARRGHEEAGALRADVAGLRHAVLRASDQLAVLGGAGSEIDAPRQALVSGELPAGAMAVPAGAMAAGAMAVENLAVLVQEMVVRLERMEDSVAGLHPAGPPPSLHIQPARLAAHLLPEISSDIQSAVSELSESLEREVQARLAVLQRELAALGPAGGQAGNGQGHAPLGTALVEDLHAMAIRGQAHDAESDELLDRVAEQLNHLTEAVVGLRRRLG